MALVITQRPYQFNWSGNPIVYGLFQEEAVNNNDIVFEVQIMFGKALDDPNYETAVVVPLTPFKGAAQIDISSILNSRLKHFLPQPLNTPVSQSSLLGTGWFYIQFRSVTADAPDAAWDNTEKDNQAMVFKGGIDEFRYKGNAFFTTYFFTEKPFLSWQKNGRLAALNERMYLCWLNLVMVAQAGRKIRADVTITYTDATTLINSYEITNNPVVGSWYYIPAGAAQLDLVASNPAKKIWYWDVQVMKEQDGADLEPITTKQRFVADNRNDYNQMVLHYRGSTGGVESVRLRGVIESTNDYEFTETERVAGSLNDYALPAKRQAEPATVTRGYKADSGLLEKEDQLRLQDAFLKREVYIEKFGRWWPVTLLTKNVRLRGSEDMRWALPFEFAIADGGADYYTPEAVNLGEGIATTNVCPATIALSFAGAVTLFGNTEVTWDYVVTGLPAGLQYKIPGWVDQWTDLPYFASASLSYTVAEGETPILYMRTICGPGIYGSVTKLAGPTVPPPAANSVVRNLTNIASEYFITRNGIEIARGTLPSASGGLSETPFHCEPGIATISITVNDMSLTLVTLNSTGLTNFGAWSNNGHTFTWTDFNIPSGGASIKLIA